MSCEKCQGTGQIVHVTTSERRLADGSTVQLSGHSTSLCECRAALPPRAGEARWWTLRPVYAATVDVPIFQQRVEITVDTEVPVSDDNYPLVTRGNRYYPTLVDVVIGDEKLLMHGDTAREFAQRLIAAADAVDACDVPDSDTCGHWAPCGCGAKVIA